MQEWKDRLINGALKYLPAIETPEEAHARLSTDIEIVTEPTRCTECDLWPCIWALAAALSRQCFGNIYINCGPQRSLPGPVPLPGSCLLGHEAPSGAIKVGVGIEKQRPQFSVCGDARGSLISYGRLIRSPAPANAISCFALAGYLGFATTAYMLGVPHFRHDLTIYQLALPGLEGTGHSLPEDGFAFLGLGHLGNSYLALLYFLSGASDAKPKVYLVDKDPLQEGNGRTHILALDEDERRQPQKANLLSRALRSRGWLTFPQVAELKWGWRKPADHPRFALLGFDNFEARRVALEAGYEWVVEAGLGSNLTQPRITWHSLSPERDIGIKVFGHDSESTTFAPQIEKPFFEELRRTPGQCGWFMFKGIAASAPSMGLVAAAYAWSEMLRAVHGHRDQTEGAAYIWSPLLPYFRSPL